MSRVEFIITYIVWGIVFYPIINKNLAPFVCNTSVTWLSRKVVALWNRWRNNNKHVWMQKVISIQHSFIWEKMGKVEFRPNVGICLSLYNGFKSGSLKQAISLFERPCLNQLICTIPSIILLLCGQSIDMWHIIRMPIHYTCSMSSFW